MTAKDKVLWMGELPAPANVRGAMAGRWDLTPFIPDSNPADGTDPPRIAVARPNGQPADVEGLSQLLDQLDRNVSVAVAVLLLPPDATEAWRQAAGRAGKIICLPDDISPADLSARVAAALDLQPTISHLQAELAVAREQAAGAARTVEEVDEEMRLAAKVQRDFLPSRLPEVGPVRFGALFRPAGWVSGDIYDVIRLDETRVGLYVVDAVGHGMPAALLTMFIKKSLQTKRIVGNTYQIVPPHVAMTELNADICDQDLSSCQFCTAVYCVIDVEAMDISFCRAGHPEPILIHADGQIEMLCGPGALLGVFPDENYHTRHMALRAGDRVVFYTDGAEDTLCGTAGANRGKMADIIRPWSRIPREELLLRLTGEIDDASDENPPQDDITIVVMDVEV